MVYTANWVIICHLPPIRGTRNNHWTYQEFRCPIGLFLVSNFGLKHPSFSRNRQGIYPPWNEQLAPETRNNHWLGMTIRLPFGNILVCYFQGLKLASSFRREHHLSAAFFFLCFRDGKPLKHGGSDEISRHRSHFLIFLDISHTLESKCNPVI